MCGICGIAEFAQAKCGEAAVQRMMAAMRHRGPDDDALLLAPPVTLGMRRLSIIDLPGGHQPVSNEDGTLAAIFNGEIYNFRELRRSLEDQGHVFRSHSDTETIVHAHEAWGEDCVHHLHGMFAFALVEMPNGPAGGARRLFLARDRLGIKPLYYAVADGRFLFASEVRALLASGMLSPRLALPGLQSYLLFGSVSEPTTLIEGIHSLPPGHRMSLRLADGLPPLRPESYWDFAPAVTHSPEARKNAEPPASQQVRQLLEAAVRRHLIADVPLGVFLSSGIDSTALVALASREHAGVHTFTAVFPEQDFSEAALARQTARRFGTRHREFLLRGEEMLARQEEAVGAGDQPSMDGINTYFVSWAARQAGLKVALSGLGGDELFGGYNTFRSTPRLEALAGFAGRTPAALRSLLAPALAKLGEASGLADRARKLASFWRTPDALPHPYFFTRALFTPPQVLQLMNGAARAAQDTPWWAWLAGAASRAKTLDEFTAVSHLEACSYLVNTLLRDTDAMSMAHSLEVRVPFLDTSLVEFVARLPGRMKQRRGVPKALLVDALADLLPAEVISQRKRTFTLPWERWLRGPLREKVAAGLTHLTPSLRAAMNSAAVEAVWQDFLEGRTSWSRPWSLYVLNEWAAHHLDRPATVPAAVESAAASPRGLASSCGASGG